MYRRSRHHRLDHSWHACFHIIYHITFYHVISCRHRRPHGWRRQKDAAKDAAKDVRQCTLLQDGKINQQPNQSTSSSMFIPAAGRQQYRHHRSRLSTDGQPTLYRPQIPQVIVKSLFFIVSRRRRRRPSRSASRTTTTGTGRHAICKDARHYYDVRLYVRCIRRSRCNHYVQLANVTIHAMYRSIPDLLMHSIQICLTG